MLHRILPVLLAAALLGGCSSRFRTDNAPFAQLAAAPSAHRGELYAFHGEIIDSHEVRGGHELQIDIAAARPTLVVTFPFRGVELVEGDYVWVLGRVAGSVEGINGFGGVQRGLELDGIAYQSTKGGGHLVSDTPLYEAWKAGTLPLGAREVPASMSVQR